MSEILGVLFAIFVGILVIPKFADYQQMSNDNTRAAATADQQKKLNKAAETYIQQNNVAIAAIATPTTPAVITVAMLQAPAVNLLPASFSDKNPYGQTWQVEVLQPTPGNLQALAMSTGGVQLPDKQVSKIASLVGAAGGFIPKNDSGIYGPSGPPTEAYGAFAGWTIPTANYTSVTGGSLASLLTFNSGQLVSNYLYRNEVPGQPQLNEMSTPLVMNSEQTVNFACAKLGAIARDASGAVLSCNGGKWKTQGSAFWQDPVGTYAALPACAASISGQTRVVKAPSAGSGPRAYTCNGAAWSALAVDDSGNLTLPGTVTTGKVQLNDVVTEGSACGANGLVAKDATGLLLSCQSGVWSRQPMPVAYSDSFDLSGFVLTSPSPCGNGSKPQRTYTLNLSKRSIITASLISWSVPDSPSAGIFLDNALCGYNHQTSANDTASSSCTLVMPAGSYQFGFCTQTNPSGATGTVVVLPNE